MNKRDIFNQRYWAIRHKEELKKLEPDLVTYSQAFHDVHNMARNDAACVNADVRRGRMYISVAAYIGKFHARPSGNKPRSSLGPKMEYKRQEVISRVLQFTEREWQLIRGRLVANAELSKGRPAWVKSRREWICELDTLRAFEHPE